MKKRKDGRYQKAITINGKKTFFYGSTVAEVNKKILEYKEKADREQADKFLLSNVIDEWYKFHATEIAANTQKFYNKPMEDVKEYFANDYIDKIRPKDISEFIKSLSKKMYSRRTLSARLMVLKLAYKYAIINNMVDTNPALVVSLPNSRKYNKRDKLTKEEIENVKNSKHLFLNTLLYTGLRRNEALALNWEDIDFKKEIIEVNKNLMWADGTPKVVEILKTESSAAVIPLLKPLKELLLPYAQKSGMIFTHKGKLYSSGTFYREWEKIKKEYNLNCCPHQFRHTFISIMHDSGVDVKTAQRLARHARVQTTLDIYTHLDDTAVNKGRAVLNDFLNKE